MRVKNKREYRLIKKLILNINIITLLCFLGCLYSAVGLDLNNNRNWVGTWACGPQIVEEYNLPPLPGLNGNTLRQAIHVSIGGNIVKLRISNEFGTKPVTLDSIYVSQYKMDGIIEPDTNTKVTFNKKN